MYFCVFERDGRTLLHEEIPASKEAFLKTIAPTVTA
jgi:hypothetical protein